MPMIDVQRRHAEVFRIRLGDKQGNRPRKLTDSIRITARNEQIVQAFVDVYGGEVTPWEGQHQAYLPTTELRILVLPGQSIQQWWEKYRGSVCERRCDGYQEQKSGSRCMCPEDIYERAEDKNACSPMTRVNVLCPDVAVVGAGSLVTHGMIAAETLPQSISVAETALARGLMVPAVLRVVLNDKGRNHFIYPQIEIVGTSMNELAAGNGAAALPHATETPLDELEHAPKPALMSPVPPSVTERPAASVADQAAVVESPPEGTRRKNAAQPLPSTGLAPRTAAEAGAGGAPSEDVSKLKKAQLVKRLHDAGLDSDGKVDVLRKRWRDHLASTVSEAPGSSASGVGAPDTREPGAAGVPPTAPPDDDADGPRPFDRDGAQKAFHAQLHDLGLDYDTQVRPWMNQQYGATLSKLDDSRLRKLLDAMDQKSMEFVVAVQEHAETTGEESPGPSLAERARAHAEGQSDAVAGYQARIREAWRVLAVHNETVYQGGWERAEKITGGRAGSSDWSGSSEAALRALAVDMERAAVEAGGDA